MTRARSLAALTLTLGALAALCPPCAAGMTGLRVTLVTDPAENADAVRVFAVGLRTGDVLLAELRAWEEEAEPRFLDDPTALGQASPEGVRDCEPWKAPLLVLRDGAFVWLGYAGSAYTPRAVVETVDLSEDEERGLAEALENPYAGLSECERRKRSGEATDELEFAPLEVAADAAPEVEFDPPEFPDDPLGEGFGPCPALTEDITLASGARAVSVGEARTLRYPDEDAERATAGAGDWLSASIQAYEEQGYTLRERRDDKRLASAGVWSACLDQVAPMPWSEALGDNVIRRTVEVFYLDTGVWGRRYAQVSLDPSETRDLLESCHEALSNPAWGRGRRKWALREVYEEHGQDAVESLLADANHGRDSRAADLAALLATVRYNYGDPIESGLEFEEFHAFLDKTVRSGCERYGVPADQVSAGLCDLYTDEFALFNGDTMRYGACVPKILGVLAVYQAEAEGKLTVSPALERTMARAIRASGMPEAAQMQRAVGLEYIREVAQRDRYRLYDPKKGGLWNGRYYSGHTGPTYRDPVAGLSHGVQARQALRYYWMLYHGLLVSPEASERIIRVFLDNSVCGILDHKFVHGLLGRGLTFVRKSGWYPPQQNDTALIYGDDRAYVLVGFVRSHRGDEFLQYLAREVDNFLVERMKSTPPEEAAEDQPPPPPDWE